MYILGEPPRGRNEAFDALENVFGSEEFSKMEAMTVLEEALDLEPDEARGEFSRLLRSDSIEEA